MSDYQDWKDNQDPNWRPEPQPPQSEDNWLDEVLTKAFNDFYDYITERDIIKAAHEYSEKTVYKEAKQAIIEGFRERLPDGDSIVQPDLSDIPDNAHWVYFKGQKYVLDQVNQLLNELGR